MKYAIIYTLTFLFCAGLFTANAQKIDLSSVSITLESGGGDPYKLIDEQSTAGDPKGGNGGSPTTNWQIDWGAGASAYLDLGQDYNLTDLYWYDTYDNQSVEFQYGSPGNWTTLFHGDMSGWETWGSESVNVTTRYIRLIYPYEFKGINELVIYGTASGGGGGDTQAPTAPTGLSSSNVTTSSVDLSWNASSDNVGVTGYDVYKDGSFHTSVSGTSATVSGLSASTSYEFKVKAKDAANNQSGFSNTISVTTSTAADTQAPTAPTGLSSSNVTTTSVDLSWNASSDNVAVTGYDVYKDGSIHTTVSGTSTTVSGLSPSTSYEFKVKAKDAADNQSGFSNTINVTTSTAADTEAPTTPTGLASSNVTSSSVSISWNASSDNVGVTGYDVYMDGSVYTTVSGTSTTVSGLSASTSYEFKVTAKDAADNQSAFSNIINVTTNSSGGGGCTTSKLTISGSMITNETGFGNATLIADEQSISGDPANGMGGSPSNTWHAGWNHAVYPVNAYLDLGAPAEISSIYLRDVNDQGQYTVSAGNPGNWQVLFTDNLTGYQSWNEHSVSITTQYLRFTMSSYTANMAEVVIYGCMGEDETAPGTITDLASTGKSSSSISLSWTAPGDDGTAGTATSYDLRYSTSGISEANFNNATQVSGVPAPSIGGSGESFTVSGLAGGTNYYFAIKTIDDAANVSAISNVLNEATEVPDVTAPSAINDLATGSSTAATMTLTWTAPGDDGSSGTASSYDIRYSQSNISSESAFDNATPVSGEPAPASAGTSQTYTVSGLTGETTYYFAIKAIDESGNASARSNTASGTTGSGYAREAITIDQFMGINSFVDDPIEKMQAVGFVREYHNWNWDEGDQWSGGGDFNYPEYPNNEIKWAPSEAGGGLWNFDDFYTNVTNAGLVISPVIQNKVNWLGGGNHNNKPIDESGASTTDPNSYEAKAHHMFQFAARYGSTPVADNLLTLDPGQPRNTGMGLINYVEDWNEQDKNWEGADAYFSPQEYAAMSSATYDGHGGTMTQGTGTFGIKNADPNMKFVMGGIWELNLQYIKDMETWYANNRPDGKFIPDVINVHHYAWNNPHPALSPEQDNFRTRLEEFTTWRDLNHPEVEVWITEFGWDTHPTSNLRVPTYGGFDQEEVQAQYLIRSWLAFAAAGVDRAAMFMLRNVNESSSVQFDNAGLTSSKDTGWQPKKSWYYTYTMKNSLTGTRYLSEQSSGNANVLIYKFKSISDDSGVYVVWCPTANATTVNSYQLNLQGNPTSVTQIEMVDNDTDGVATSLNVSNGAVTVDVSERPIFIVVDDIQ